MALMGYATFRTTSLCVSIHTRTFTQVAEQQSALLLLLFLALALLLWFPSSRFTPKVYNRFSLSPMRAREEELSEALRSLHYTDALARIFDHTVVKQQAVIMSRTQCDNEETFPPTEMSEVILVDPKGDKSEKEIDRFLLNSDLRPMRVHMLNVRAHIFQTCKLIHTKFKLDYT